MRKWNDLFWFLDFFRHRPNFHQRLTKSMTILHKAKAPLPPFLFHLSILWIFIRDVCQKKTGKCGNFSQVGDPPLPPVWEPHVCEKKNMVYFAFLDLRNIFGFHKNVHFLGGIMVCRSGNGWPPLKRKISTLSRFVWFFYRMSTRGPKTKLT